MSPYLRARPPHHDPKAGLSLCGAAVVAVQIGGEAIYFTADMAQRDVVARSYLARKQPLRRRIARAIIGGKIT